MSIPKTFYGGHYCLIDPYNVDVSCFRPDGHDRSKEWLTVTVLSVSLTFPYIYILDVLTQKPYSKPLERKLHSDNKIESRDFNDVKSDHGSV